MQRERRIILTLVLMSTAWWLGAPPSTADAHGADLKAFLTFEPPALAPGPHTVRLELLDFYDNAVPQAKVKTEVWGAGPAPMASSDLQEDHPGTHRGQMMLPEPGRVELRVEAVLPDGPWRGRATILLGESRWARRPIGVILQHTHGPLVTPLGVAVLALAGVMLIGSLAGIVLEVSRHIKARTIGTA